MFQDQPPEMMDGAEKLFGTWYFVRQNWDGEDKWPVNPLGFELSSIKYPVLVRHMHEDLDKKHYLDWKMLNNLWSSQNLPQRAENRRKFDKICKLASYCESHGKWIFDSAEHCELGNFRDRCQTKIFLHCHIDEHSVFRVFDPTHGFLPSLFG